MNEPKMAVECLVGDATRAGMDEAGILTDDVIAVFRRPVAAQRLSAVAQSVPADSYIEIRGEWMVITRGKGGEQ